MRLMRKLRRLRYLFNKYTRNICKIVTYAVIFGFLWKTLGSVCPQVVYANDVIRLVCFVLVVMITRKLTIKTYPMVLRCVRNGL